MRDLVGIEMTRATRGVILYDFLQVPGGAENVTVTLAHGLGNSDLCVGSVAPEHYHEFDLSSLKTVDLGVSRMRPPLHTVATLRAFQRRTEFVAGYDWAIYGGSYAPVAVHHRHAYGNYYYCHTLPRAAYDLRTYYLGMLPGWKRPAFRSLTAYIRRRFEVALEHMDLIIANSDNVRRRISFYLGKDATVVYPPCDVDSCFWQSQEGYYLSLARLEPYKRVDVVIQAFLRMPERTLVVASGGSDLARLKRLADNAGNIHFTGWVDKSKLRELISRSIATVYVPRDEDFGISVVESMAAGKPVIGVAEGGLLETVLDGQTGILVGPEIDSDLLVEAVSSLGDDRALAMREACEQRAQMFRTDVFLERMRAIVEREFAGQQQ